MLTNHLQAVFLTRNIKVLENRLIEVVIKIDKEKSYTKFLRASLFVYCTEELSLTDARAYELITVARKAKEIPELREALAKREISISKSARIVSSLSKDNAKELVDFAKSNTVKATEKKLRDEGLKPKYRKVKFEEETVDLMKQLSVAMNTSLEEAVKRSLKESIAKYDKLEKAKRARKPKPTLDKKGRHAIPAATKHTVYKKFEAQCAIKDHKGERCPNKRFLHIHHIKEVQHGGTNTLENLILVCSEHHEQIHQMQFPLGDAASWRNIIEQSAH